VQAAAVTHGPGASSSWRQSVATAAAQLTHPIPARPAGGDTEDATGPAHEEQKQQAQALAVLPNGLIFASPSSRLAEAGAESGAAGREAEEQLSAASATEGGYEAGSEGRYDAVQSPEA
jgi:hypothetical protein